MFPGCYLFVEHKADAFAELSSRFLGHHMVGMWPGATSGSGRRIRPVDEDQTPVVTKHTAGFHEQSVSVFRLEKDIRKYHGVERSVGELCSAAHLKVGPYRMEVVYLASSSLRRKPRDEIFLDIERIDNAVTAHALRELARVCTFSRAKIADSHAGAHAERVEDRERVGEHTLRIQGTKKQGNKARLSGYQEVILSECKIEYKKITS